jgi:hypothetical protein
VPAVAAVLGRAGTAVAANLTSERMRVKTALDDLEGIT